MLSRWEALLEKDQELAAAVSALLASCQLREQYYIQISTGNDKLLGVSEASIQELAGSINVAYQDEKSRRLVQRKNGAWQKQLKSLLQ